VTASLAAWFSRFPEGWWGYHWAPPEPMSVVQIAGSGSIDQRLMATLWAVVSRRRSVMLASEAPQAGKTTTLSALVDFLPDDTVGVFLRGSWGDYRWTDEYGPDRAYLLINEMSDHLPIYVWGRNAKGALELAGRGYGLGATMHADSLDEAIETLRDGVGATDTDLTGLTIYLQFSAYRTPAGTYRRCEEAWHLRSGADGALQPVRLAAIEGGRSPRLTGAQRLPVPPILRTDGGRRATPRSRLRWACRPMRSSRSWHIGPRTSHGWRIRASVSHRQWLRPLRSTLTRPRDPTPAFPKEPPHDPSRRHDPR
jgi:hypothetical protein